MCLEVRARSVVPLDVSLLTRISGSGEHFVTGGEEEEWGGVAEP